MQYFMFSCSNRHISFYAQAAYIRGIDDSMALLRPLVGLSLITWASLGSPVLFWAFWAVLGSPGLSEVILGSPGLPVSNGFPGLACAFLGFLD